MTTTPLAPVEIALSACHVAAAHSDLRAFWLAHMRLEAEMMRLATQTWGLRPQKPVRVRLLRGPVCRHGGRR
jgi:hypothetical protein